MARLALYDLGLAVLRAEPRDLLALVELLDKRENFSRDAQLDQMAQGLVRRYWAKTGNTLQEATKNKVMAYSRELKGQTDGLKDELKVKLDDGTEDILHLERIQKALDHYRKAIGGDYHYHESGEYSFFLGSEIEGNPWFG